MTGLGFRPGGGEIRALIGPARRHRPHSERATGLQKSMRPLGRTVSRWAENQLGGRGGQLIHRKTRFQAEQASIARVVVL
jgi:hypothetical protein